MMAEYIYGINPVFEVLRARRRRIHRAYLQEGLATSPRLKKLAELLKAQALPLEQVSKQRLFQLCASKEHQGCLLQTTSYPYVSGESLLDQARLLLLDNVEDPQNVGAILRSAEVFGWSAVLLSAKGVPAIYPSVVKASAGATEYLRIARDHAANVYVKKLQALGYSVLALDQRGKQDIMTLPKHVFSKLLLVIGGEHRSVGQYILNQAQYVVSIGQRGRVQSLNASVAAGIAMFMLGAAAPPASQRS